MRILVAIPNEYRCLKERFLPTEVIEELEKLGEVIYNPLNRPYTTEELRDALVDIDVLFAGWSTVDIDNEVISKANRLKVIASATGSVAHIKDEIYEKGIIVLSGNSVFAESVAEATVCYMMNSLRDNKYFIVRDGFYWRTDERRPQKGLMDRTVGLVGFGMIAKFVLKMLQPFRVKIKVCSEYASEEELAKHGAEKATLDEIFETCDIVSIHSGLNPNTYHMIDGRLLKKMKDGALLVNTARGSVIDEKALIEELATGRIDAALDVFEEEPPVADSPLRKMDNVTIYPHIAGPTLDRYKYVSLELIRDIALWQKGEKNLTSQITLSYSKNMTRGGFKVVENGKEKVVVGT